MISAWTQARIGCATEGGGFRSGGVERAKRSLEPPRGASEAPHLQRKGPGKRKARALLAIRRSFARARFGWLSRIRRRSDRDRRRILKREAVDVARCAVERLMRKPGNGAAMRADRSGVARRRVEDARAPRNAYELLRHLDRHGDPRAASVPARPGPADRFSAKCHKTAYVALYRPAAWFHADTTTSMGKPNEHCRSSRALFR